MKRSYLIDVNNTSREIEIKDDLQEFYKVLNCSTIDIVSREIGGKYYDIVCDDEGLCNNNPIVSAYDRNCRPMLVGNLLIFGVGEDGELGSLTDEDVEHIKKSIRTIPLETGSTDILFCEY